MYTQLGLYIDGEWLNGDNRAGEDVINPSSSPRDQLRGRGAEHHHQPRRHLPEGEQQERGKPDGEIRGL